MIVTIHQPEYLPWIGFFDRVIKSDVFVILDHVQYQKNGFINRNRIKNANGAEWLTVPVSNQMKHDPICKVDIGSNDWQKKHYQSIVFNYVKAPYFEKYHVFFQEMYHNEWRNIAELDIYFITQILLKLGIKTKIVRSSEWELKSQSTDLLVDICQKLNADTYLSGEGGRRYMEHEKFARAGIKIEFQTFVHPIYPQLFPGAGFVPQLSFIDLLFNCGEEGLQLLK